MRIAPVVVALVSAAALTAAPVSLYPDYAGIAVPPNIAPLNFDVRGGQGKIAVTLGNTKGVSETFGRAVRVGERFWRHLLDDTAYTITVTENGNRVFSATNTIVNTPIDPVLSYRLIPPSYENYNRIGIWWRDLTCFEERPFYTNYQSSSKQCVNCHTFHNYNPDASLFHLRASDPGTVIFRGKDDAGRKTNLKGGPFFGAGVYPAWHPEGRFIAFSVNETRQVFYFANPDKIEVLDGRSDMMLYDLDTNEALPVELSEGLFDCFPAWSPDGNTLYSVVAEPGFGKMPEDSKERTLQAIGGYTNLCYNLVERRFDRATRRFSKPRMILDAASSKRSVTLPRVSPDGRWLVFSLGPQGVFHVWHRQSDLWMLDLKKNSIRPLTEINSSEAESYHSFSSDGTWMVFSSRRDDGAYTRPYFTHFDAETGHFTKPFLLPQLEPSDHLRRMESYNIPEFAKGRPSRTPRDVRRTAEGPAASARFPRSAPDELPFPVENSPE